MAEKGLVRPPEVVGLQTGLEAFRAKGAVVLEAARSEAAAVL